MAEGAGSDLCQLHIPQSLLAYIPGEGVRGMLLHTKLTRQLISCLSTKTCANYDS